MLLAFGIQLLLHASRRSHSYSATARAQSLSKLSHLGGALGIPARPLSFPGKANLQVKYSKTFVLLAGCQKRLHTNKYTLGTYQGRLGSEFHPETCMPLLILPKLVPTEAKGCVRQVGMQASKTTSPEWCCMQVTSHPTCHPTSPVTLFNFVSLACPAELSKSAASPSSSSARRCRDHSSLCFSSQCLQVSQQARTSWAD